MPMKLHTPTQPMTAKPKVFELSTPLSATAPALELAAPLPLPLALPLAFEACAPLPEPPVPVAELWPLALPLPPEAKLLLTASSNT